MRAAMASKWLAAFRETEDAPLPVSQSCAVSADSADSTLPPSQTRPNGTNDTIGTHEQKPEQPGSNAGYPTVGDDLHERAALVECGANVPRRWAEGYAALCTMPAPTGFSSERWARIVDATGHVLDHWAAEAIKAGGRISTRSAAMPRRLTSGSIAWASRSCSTDGRVSSIDQAGADLVTETGTVLRYRRRPLPRHTISLWQL